MATTLGGVLRMLKAHAHREGRGEAFDALEGHFGGVAQQLEVLRVRQGLTQRDLAERTEIHQAGVSRILSGKTQPRIDTAERLARTLGAELRVVRISSAKTLKRQKRRRSRRLGPRRAIPGRLNSASDARLPARRRHARPALASRATRSASS